MQSYERPTRLEEALQALDAQEWLMLAGGTDVYPAHVGKALERPVLDLTALSALRGITQDEAGIHIGALTTWTDIVLADLPPHSRH